MGSPVVSPLTGRLDMALSNFVKGFRNNRFVADILFPRVPVLRQTDRYYIFGRENQQLKNKTLRAPGAPAERFRFTLSTDSYFAPSRALAADIPDEDRSSYMLGDLNMHTAQMIWDNLMLDRESRTATLATTAANYAAGMSLDLSSTHQWDDYANSDPIVDVDTAKGKVILSGQPANTLVLGDSVYRKLRNHPKILARFQYKDATPAAIGPAQLAAAFDVENVVVASSLKDNGDGTQTFLWGKVAVLAYVSPNVGPAGLMNQLVGPSASNNPTAPAVGSEGLVGPRDISFGKTFVWTGAPLTINGYGVVIARNPDPTAKGDILGVDWYAAEKITATETGYLFYNAIS